VQCTGVSVKPAGCTAVDFTFDASKDINLLALTDANSADLLNGERLEAEVCRYPAALLLPAIKPPALLSTGI